jgi:hypothetical protein
MKPLDRVFLDEITLYQVRQHLVVFFDKLVLVVRTSTYDSLCFRVVSTNFFTQFIKSGDSLDINYIHFDLSMLVNLAHVAKKTKV